MFDWLTDGIDSLMQTIGDYFLYNFFFRLFYYLEIGLCYVLNWMEQLYRVFTGMEDVRYDGEATPLFDVFFHNTAVNGVFIGMALIGIVFAFVSAIIQSVRKAMDLDDKIKMSHGQILGNLFKSILIIVCMNISVTIVTAFVDTLMDAVDYTFDNAYALGSGPDEKYFTKEENAAMGRIFNTIGNYSLNPSYKNRYSINACYNEIRPDLMYLAGRNVFKFNYETLDEDGNIIPTWQSVIANIANAADYTKEQPVDVYNEGIANAISDAMDILKSNATLEHLDYYYRYTYPDDNEVGFDRIVFVTATMGFARTAAAKNDEFNKRPAMNDSLREPYFRGTKDIYDIDQVNQDFDISIFKTNYIVAYVITILLIFNMGLIILTAVARIFNMIFLYIISPPIIGLMPLDDGQKFQQWLTAFIVQTFSIFATVISMRLYLIFIPVIMSPALEISENVLIDIIGKVMLMYGGMEAVGKANGILTGILADQAGMQSIQAGDMKASLGKMGMAAAAMGTKAMGFGRSAVSGAAASAGRVGSMAGSSISALMNRGGGQGSGSSTTEALPDKSSISGAPPALPDSGRAGGMGGGSNLPSSNRSSGGIGGMSGGAGAISGGGGDSLPGSNRLSGAMSGSMGRGSLQHDSSSASRAASGVASGAASGASGDGGSLPGSHRSGAAGQASTGGAVNNAASMGGSNQGSGVDGRTTDMYDFFGVDRQGEVPASERQSNSASMGGAVSSAPTGGTVNSASMGGSNQGSGVDGRTTDMYDFFGVDRPGEVPASERQSNSASMGGAVNSASAGGAVNSASMSGSRQGSGVDGRTTDMYDFFGVDRQGEVPASERQSNSASMGGTVSSASAGGSVNTGATSGTVNTASTGGTVNTGTTGGTSTINTGSTGRSVGSQPTESDSAGGSGYRELTPSERAGYEARAMAAEGLRSASTASVHGVETAAGMVADTVEGAGGFIADSFRFVAGEEFPRGAVGGSQNLRQSGGEDDEYYDSSLPGSQSSDFREDTSTVSAGSGSSGAGAAATAAPGASQAATAATMTGASTTAATGAATAAAMTGAAATASTGSSRAATGAASQAPSSSIREAAGAVRGAATTAHSTAPAGDTTAASHIPESERHSFVSGDNPGREHTATQSTGQDPATTQSTVQDPAASHSIVQDPAASQSAVQESPASHNPVQESAISQSMGHNPTASQNPGQEPTASQSTGQDSATSRNTGRRVNIPGLPEDDYDDSLPDSHRGMFPEEEEDPSTSNNK